jgi:hypothetical protein
MNHYQDEINAEYHRQAILNETEQVRLENIARSSHIHQPGIYERTMYNFANWMISTGKQLRRRYEIPAVQCNHATRSPAR